MRQRSISTMSAVNTDGTQYELNSPVPKIEKATQNLENGVISGSLYGPSRSLEVPFDITCMTSY